MRQSNLLHTIRGILFFTVLLFYLTAIPCYADDDVYLAGAPDQWPFEYYDKSSGDYFGIIPDMLRMAGKQAGISVRYLNPSETDHRLSMAANAQVDAYSTIGLEGQFDGTELLTFEEAGESFTITLAYSQSIPDSTRRALENGLETIDSAQIQGLYLHYSRNQSLLANRIVHYRLLLAGGCAVFLLLILLLYLRSRMKNRQIRRLAYIDDTTGRDNLAAFREKYEKYIVAENREHYAILFLAAGIDSINHIYGYEEAHRALRLISETCVPLINEEFEGFCRFHEFGFVFFIQYHDIEQAKNRVRQIQDNIKTAFEEAKKTYFLDFHTGIYRLRQIDDNMLRAIQYSEAALEYAQMYYLDLAVYDEYVEHAAISGYAMEHEAVHGLMHQEFIMYLQPIINLNTGNIVAAEALVRWKNPKRGLLQPEEFLKTMRRKQLIGKMNMDIYRQGCRFLKEETVKGNPLQMLFNFTAENIGDEQFASHIHAVVEQYQLDASLITIQLNQIVEVARVESFKETIQALRKNGFNVCLAGLEFDRVFLEYLHCGINTIKLRRELIHQLDQPKGLKLLQSIIALCHELELNIICVGVENETQASVLRELGCELASGFYYYYPLSPKTFSENYPKKQIEH